MKKNKNHIIKYFIISFCISICIPQNVSAVNSTETIISIKQRNMLKQAKALESSGLADEAILAYKNIFDQFPYFREVFLSLKYIYIKNNNINEALELAQRYIEAKKFSNTSKMDAFEIYVFSNNSYQKEIITSIVASKAENFNNIKKILSILLQYDKESEAVVIINKIRKNKKSFYTLELGTYFSLKLDIDKSLNEYLIYLEYQPKNIKVITQRIMFLSNNISSINNIINTLSKSDLTEAKIIHSKLEFKLNNFDRSYEIIKEIENNGIYKIDLVNDLIKVDDFELSQKIIEDILNSKVDKKILNQAIFQLASLYEKQITLKSDAFPISNQIFRNQILDSPFIKLNSDYSNLLNKAINIYDSLSTYNKDYKSRFQLAEIKYKIIGDLDGAKNIYSDIYKKFPSVEYKKKALSNLIDINLSKGDIQSSFNIIDSLYGLNLPDEIRDLLDLKKIQLYYYTMNRDSVIQGCNNNLKKIQRDNSLYNDILDISSSFSFYSDEELKKFIEAKFKIMQNKRSQAIEILKSIENNNKIYDLANLESAYLEVLQENYLNAINNINNIDSTLSNYKENRLLLKAEIYDYGLNDISSAVDLYLNFLDLFPSSIFYDLIRIRLRELAL